MDEQSQIIALLQDMGERLTKVEQLLGRTPPAPHPMQKWFGGQEAAAALGMSEAWLKHQRLVGHLTENVHYRQTSSPHATSPRYQYNIEAIEKLLNTPASRRKVRR